MQQPRRRDLEYNVDGRGRGEVAEESNVRGFDGGRTESKTCLSVCVVDLGDQQAGGPVAAGRWD